MTSVYEVKKTWLISSGCRFFIYLFIYINLILSRFLGVRMGGKFFKWNVKAKITKGDVDSLKGKKKS